MRHEERVVDRYCRFIGEVVQAVENAPYYEDQATSRRVYKRGRIIKCLNAVECRQSGRPGERLCWHLDGGDVDPLEIVRDR